MDGRPPRLCARTGGGGSGDEKREIITITTTTTTTRIIFSRSPYIGNGRGGGKAFKKGFSFYYVLTRPHARGLFELITRGVVRPCRQCIRVHKRIRSIYKGIFILFRSTRTCFMSFSFFLFLSPCPPHTSPSTPVAALHAN